MLQEHQVQLTVEEITVEDSISCGFRQEHLSGEGGGASFELMSGAGCGSPWITAMVERDGKERYYRVDARKLLTSIIKLSEGDG